MSNRLIKSLDQRKTDPGYTLLSLSVASSSSFSSSCSHLVFRKHHERRVSPAAAQQKKKSHLKGLFTLVDIPTHPFLLYFLSHHSSFFEFYPHPNHRVTLTSFPPPSILSSPVILCSFLLLIVLHSIRSFSKSIHRDKSAGDGKKTGLLDKWRKSYSFSSPSFLSAYQESSYNSSERLHHAIISGREG